MGQTRVEALEAVVAAPEFYEVLPGLDIEVRAGAYISYCGIVCGHDGKPVLVGIFRHKNAGEDVPYSPPTLGYLCDTVSVSPPIQRANIKWRLPKDEKELHSLLGTLQGS